MGLENSPLISENLINEFRICADEICEIARNNSLAVKGYHDQSLPIFSALTDHQKKVALQHLKNYLNTLLAASASGEIAKEERFVWHALAVLGLKPPSDLFHHLKQGTAIEIYNLKNIQIWRNFTCLRFCSYTLEEIYSIDVFNRYERDAHKMKECIEKVSNLLAGKTENVYFPQITPHRLIETQSQDKLHLEVNHEIFSVLRDDSGEIAAWLVMSSAKVLTKPKFASRPALRLVTELAQ